MLRSHLGFFVLGPRISKTHLGSIYRDDYNLSKELLGKLSNGDQQSLLASKFLFSQVSSLKLKFKI